MDIKIRSDNLSKIINSLTPNGYRVNIMTYKKLSECLSLLDTLDPERQCFETFIKKENFGLKRGYLTITSDSIICRNNNDCAVFGEALSKADVFEIYPKFGKDDNGSKILIAEITLCFNDLYFC